MANLACSPVCAVVQFSIKNDSRSNTGVEPQQHEILGRAARPQLGQGRHVYIVVDLYRQSEVRGDLVAEVEIPPAEYVIRFEHDPVAHIDDPRRRQTDDAQACLGPRSHFDTLLQARTMPRAPLQAGSATRCDAAYDLAGQGPKRIHSGPTSAQKICP